MKLIVCLIALFSASLACEVFTNCNQCVHNGCTFSLFLNKTKTCREKALFGRHIIASAKTSKHCDSLRIISTGWKLESTTVQPKIYRAPLLLPVLLAGGSTTATEKLETRATTMPPNIISVPSPKTTTEVPFSATTSQPSSSTIASTFAVAPVAQPPISTSSPTRAKPHNETFVVSKRNGVASVSVRKVTNGSSCSSPMISHGSISNVDLFSKVSTKECNSKELTPMEESYMRTLCSLNRVANFIPHDQFTDADKAFLLLNPARANNYTCNILFARRRVCIQMKRPTIRKLLKRENRKRPTFIFQNMTTEQACKHGKVEPPQETFGRLTCRARLVASMIPAESVSLMDYFFMILNPSFGYENFCDALFYRRSKCNYTT